MNLGLYGVRDKLANTYMWVEMLPSEMAAKRNFEYTLIKFQEDANMKAFFDETHYAMVKLGEVLEDGSLDIEGCPRVLDRYERGEGI